ncbi:MAG: hypothetical protein IJ124_13305 [Clostridia bacterium]|nr:hypothetical protein [Clostridia bacterium]MBQ8963881.1 hypothetical protein [Clostridia bacterium]
MKILIKQASDALNSILSVQTPFLVCIIFVTTVTTVTTYVIPQWAVTVISAMAFIGHAVSGANQQEHPLADADSRAWGAKSPIKYASQINSESNLFDEAYLALGE